MEEETQVTRTDEALFDWGEAGQDPAPQPEPAAEPEPTLTVKYHGKEQQIPMTEARTLAQKGMVFDDVSKKLDAALPAFELMGRYAQAAGVSVEEYVDKARSQLDSGAPAPLGADRRRQFVELLTRYPDAVDGTGRLPDSVMAQVARGESPVHAYERYALEQYRMGEQARRTDQQNRASVPGSARGLGAALPADPFTAGWDSEN